MKMSFELMQECIGVIARYGKILLTEKQFRELLDENPDLEDQLIRFCSPSDTMDRECMIEALALKITGRPWPMYGDGEEVAKQFYRDLRSMGIAQGYDVLFGTS